MVPVRGASSWPWEREVGDIQEECQNKPVDGFFAQ